MNTRVASVCFSLFVGSLLLASVPIRGVAADADAAKALAKKSGCLACHSVNKTKTGPSFQKVAAANKGKADAEKMLTEFITTGPKIKVAGSDAEHAIVKSKDPKEVKNLVDWILAQ